MRTNCTCGQATTPNESQPYDPWCPVHGKARDDIDLATQSAVTGSGTTGTGDTKSHQPYRHPGDPIHPVPPRGVIIEQPHVDSAEYLDRADPVYSEPLFGQEAPPGTGGGV